MPVSRYIHISRVNTRSKSSKAPEIDQTEWFQNLAPPRSNPLLVEDYRLADNYVIASPPVNSSGDVYHYLAYLILCRAKQWYVPRVYIGYDDKTTRMQATRGVELARQLGFTERVIAVSLDKNNGASHSNSREKQLRDEMNERDLKTINQKGVTTLLACAYRKYGYNHITAILQQGFLQFDRVHIDQATLLQLKTHARAEIQRIRDRTQRPMVILNNRVSKGANAQQSLPSETVRAIRDTVRSQGYELFILSTSGDEIATHKRCPASAAFYTGGAEAKYGKAYHLILLYELSQTNYIQGVIGGTSGTLDIAGFLGFRCFNIHEFTNTERRKTIQSQEYRILVQNTWMTIMPSWSAYVRDSLVAWLHNTKNVYRLPEDRQLTSRTNHNDRHPFTCFNNEDVPTCSKKNAFQPYKRMLDTIVGNQLTSGQESDPVPWCFKKFDLF